jgi:transglutaminase-like putative cysteine protease
MRKKPNGTDGSLLASLPWTLAALSFAIFPHTPYLPVWVTAICVACAGGRWLIERRRWHLPPAWFRVLVALLCFLGILASYETISGVGPGSALLAVMAALKLLETRQRRDQFVLLFIAVFLIMSSLLREQYLWSLPYLFAGLVLTMTAWLQMSVSRGTSVRQAFRDASRLIGYAIPLMLFMWVFFPRLASPFWAVPIDTSGAVTGLSDRMSPGDISSLSQSEAVAFRVRFEGAVPEPRQRYWRGMVLHRFNGRTWSGNEPSIVSRDRWPVEYLGEPVRYQVTMEPTRQHWVVALELPYDWSLDKTFMGQQQQLARAQPIDQRIVYSVVSHPEFRVDQDLNRFSRDYHLRLPDDTNPRTADFARRLRTDAGNDVAFIEAVLRKFNEEEYYYTLDPPPLGRDSVDEFLFETRRGFCEHYASAFAVLMRAAGIPARVVIGYQGGEINPMGSYMIVRQSDAHAWTELWLDGRGWHRVDPTAAVAPERINDGMSSARFADAGIAWGLSAPSRLLHRLQLTWDALNAKWNEWILGYGPGIQESFMQWLGMEQPDWRKMLLTLLGFVAATLALISALLLRRYRPPRKDAAAVLYTRFLRKAGQVAAVGETPSAYAARLSAVDPVTGPAARRVASCYLAARYGASDASDLDRLRRAIDEFPRRTVRRLRLSR